MKKKIKFKRRIRQYRHHWILHLMMEVLRNPLIFFVFCWVDVVAVVVAAEDKVSRVPHTDGV